MEVLKAQKEIGKKYKTHFFAMFSHLFCTITEEVINEFGDKGREAIAKAVIKFGEERGRRVAELVKSHGKELNMQNFFIYSDLDSSSIVKMKPKIVDGNPEIIIKDCVFCNACRDWDRETYGKLYCEYVDEAILKGYNPELALEISSRLTMGDKNCHFKYSAK